MTLHILSLPSVLLNHFTVESRASIFYLNIKFNCTYLIKVRNLSIYNYSI